MRVVASLVTCAVVLSGCATPPPPFAATWYMVSSSKDGIESSVIHIALLNQSKGICTIGAIELTGVETDQETKALKAASRKINGKMWPGQVLVLPADKEFEPKMRACTVPVRILVKVEESQCKTIDRYGNERDPEFHLVAGFPTSLPYKWESDCTTLPYE